MAAIRVIFLSFLPSPRWGPDPPAMVAGPSLCLPGRSGRKAGRTARGGPLPWRAPAHQTPSQVSPRRSCTPVRPQRRGDQQDDTAHGTDSNASGQGPETPVIRQPRRSEPPSPPTRFPKEPLFIDDEATRRSSLFEPAEPTEPGKPRNGRRYSKSSPSMTRAQIDNNSLGPAVRFSIACSPFPLFRVWLYTWPHLPGSLPR